VWLVSSLAAAVLTQYVSPFFYLCSFQQSDTDQSSADVEQVALSVSIVGEPHFYVPGQLYDGTTPPFSFTAPPEAVAEYCVKQSAS